MWVRSDSVLRSVECRLHDQCDGTGRDLPGAGSKKRAVVRSRAVALSPAERQWAAATTEGLLLYSLDNSLVFDPTDLGQDVTPQAALQASADRQHLKALLLAVRLNDQQLLTRVLLEIPPSEVNLNVSLARYWTAKFKC